MTSSLLDVRSVKGMLLAGMALNSPMQIEVSFTSPYPAEPIRKVTCVFRNISRAVIDVNCSGLEVIDVNLIIGMRAVRSEFQMTGGCRLSIECEDMNFCKM